MDMNSQDRYTVSHRILRLPKVRELVGLGKTAIYGKIKAGDFPRPIKLGHVSGWLEAEVQAWIDAQILASRPPAIDATNRRESRRTLN